MNLQNKSQIAYLQIPPLMWKNFRQAMLNTRQEREEVIGFFFCQRYQLSKKKIKYVPQAWVVPTAECYEYQSVSGLVLKQSFHQYLFDTYLYNPAVSKQHTIKQLNLDSFCDYGYSDDKHQYLGISDRLKVNSDKTSQQKLDVVHIHTHLGNEPPVFSYIDDRHEAEYARFLTSSCSDKPRLISGVFDENLEQSQFRIWDRQGIYHTGATRNSCFLKSAIAVP